MRGAMSYQQSGINCRLQIAEEDLSSKFLSIPSPELSEDPCKIVSLSNARLM